MLIEDKDTRCSCYESLGERIMYKLVRNLFCYVGLHSYYISYIIDEIVMAENCRYCGKRKIVNYRKNEKI